MSKKSFSQPDDKETIRRLEAENNAMYKKFLQVEDEKTQLASMYKSLLQSIAFIQNEDKVQEHWVEIYEKFLMLGKEMVSRSEYEKVCTERDNLKGQVETYAKINADLVQRIPTDTRPVNPPEYIQLLIDRGFVQFDGQRVIKSLNEVARALYTFFQSQTPKKSLTAFDLRQFKKNDGSDFSESAISRALNQCNEKIT